MQRAGWAPDKLFMPTEDIEDDKPKKFAVELASLTGKSAEDIWLTIGKDNILTFFQTYPAFFRKENLYSFLRSMFDVHVVMTKRLPGAKPPELLIQPVSSTEAVLSYRSSRGMFGYMKGLLAGAAEHFKENIQTEIIASSPDSMSVKIKFPQPIRSTVSYPLNRLLSFGIFRSVPIKIGLLTMVAALILSSAFAMAGLASPLWGAVAGGVAALVFCLPASQAFAHRC